MKKIRLLLASMFLFVVVGCAPTFESMKVPLNPGGELEVIRAEPDWRSVIVVGVVRDDSGKLVGVVPGHGMTKAEVIFNSLETATSIAVPFILGNKMIKAAGKIEKPWASRTESPDND